MRSSSFLFLLGRKIGSVFQQKNVSLRKFNFNFVFNLLNEIIKRVTPGIKNAFGIDTFLLYGPIKDIEESQRISVIIVRRINKK